MTRLTAHAAQIAEDLAQQHGFGLEAVHHMIRAVDAGWGSMASFDHPEFGGPGQWMQGGMIMLGEPFNHPLRAKVDALCSEIAGAYEAEGHLTDRGGPANRAPWPPSLGTPASSGSQGDMHYAWFPETHRLALIRHGRLEIFDTGDHRITGVAQQQNDRTQDIRFTSQNGTLELDALEPVTAVDAPAQDAGAATSASTGASSSADDILRAIERLGELRDRGLLTDAEFNAKKTELLNRL